MSCRLTLHQSFDHLVFFLMCMSCRRSGARVVTAAADRPEARSGKENVAAFGAAAPSRKLRSVVYKARP